MTFKKVEKSHGYRGNFGENCPYINWFESQKSIYISESARALMGVNKGDYVELFIDEENNRVAISLEKSQDARKITGNWTISCSYLPNMIEIEKTFPAEISLENGRFVSRQIEEVD